MPARRKRKAGGAAAAAAAPAASAARKVQKVQTTAARPSAHEMAAALGLKTGAAQVVRAATAAAKKTKKFLKKTTKNPTKTANLIPMLDLGRGNLVRATMVCRPSKRNRSPYVADVRLDGDGREAIAHVPCLDMGGKCVKGAKLLLKVARDRKGVPVGASALGKYGTPKCEFITQLLWNEEREREGAPPEPERRAKKKKKKKANATKRHKTARDIHYNTWVVAHPSLGEKIAESIVAAGLLGGALPKVESFQREVRNICGANMRTDFVLSHEDGTRSVMEVKTVVDTDVSKSTARARLAEHDDAVRREEEEHLRRQHQQQEPPLDVDPSTKGNKTKMKKFKSKLKRPILFPSALSSPYVRAGIFPWGSCKQVGPDGEKVVSARAIKHVDELAKIARGDIKDENDEALGAAVLFVVGRQDAALFRPNVDGCASFARHLAAAKDAGVRVLAHRVVWGDGDDIGKAFWGGELPVEL
jgi:DNA-binding sugar fermentation-stimulating protein